MTQLQRFLFLLVLLVLASGLIYGFDSTRKKKAPAKQYQTQTAIQPSSTPYPTLSVNHWEGYNSQDLYIEGKQYHVLVADTPARQELGLMFVTELEGYDGMVFYFPDSSVKAFWNKNTLIDLNIIWMNDDTVIGKEKLPSIYKTGNPKTISSPGAVNTVVELLIGK